MSGRRAGCPGLQEGPDVRAGGQMSVLAVKPSVVSGAGRRISRLRGRPDVRGAGPDVRAIGVVPRCIL